MLENDAKMQNAKSRLVRTIAIAILTLAIIAVLISAIVLPGMEILFLRKGFEYAREKTMSVMPTVEGFNPEIHRHDPLDVSESFVAISEALRIDTLLSEDFQKNSADFMTLFKNCYDDQVIMPEEQTRIIEGLENLQRYLLTTHFSEIQRNLAMKVGKQMPGIDNDDLQGILEYESVAIHNSEAKLKMTGALSLKLVNSYYTHIDDGEISREEAEKLYELAQKIERFQIRNEIAGASKSIFSSDEFAKFPQKQAFRENISIILSKMRDIDYNYSRIKPALRKFITLCKEQELGSDYEIYDLKPFFEISENAKDYAIDSGS